MTTTRFRAEIAGGGLAALTAAIRLAQAGWQVRVHERNAEIRDAGAGIYIWENGLRVLEAVGAREAAVLNATRGVASELRDNRNRVIPRLVGEGEKGMVRVYALPRQQLLQALLGAAQRSGVAIATRSEAVAAEAGGVLVLRSGERLAADLVLGADGVGSRVRDSLDLVRESELLPEGAFRTLIPRLPADGDDRFVEHWNGARRVLVTPCAPDRIYLALTCPHDDPAARLPFDPSLWLEAFPHLRGLIERIEPGMRWDRYSLIKLKRWSAGHVAVTGDAAHAMPPNLGQGGGMAMQNALSLACELAEVRRRDDIPRALADWELRERELTEHTQVWSMLYGLLANCPDDMRVGAMDAMARHPWLSAQRLRTARHEPTGTRPLPADGL